MVYETNVVHINQILTIWLAAFLIIASTTDILVKRIPNLLTIPTIILMIAAHSLVNGWNGFCFSLAGCLVGFFALILPYAMGGMGAGDVKFLTGIGAAMGMSHTIHALLFIALFGGLVSFFFLLRNRLCRGSASNLFTLFVFTPKHAIASLFKNNKTELLKRGIPFGLAISCGVCSYVFFLLAKGTTFTLIPM